MVDILSIAERSVRMAKVRPRGNRSTELALCSALRRSKVSGWRRHARLSLGTVSRCGRLLAGYSRPDFVFTRPRAVVFVDGCFWHACPLHRTKPENNRAFWQRKLTANRVRDRQMTRALQKRGWTVVRIWEHDIKRQPDLCVQRIRAALIATR